MKKMICFFILSLTACKDYTIQNNYREDVRAGYVVINSGQCLPFSDFPFLGDFPLKFRYKDHQLMSDELFPPGHYTISEKGEILKQKTACELDPVRKKETREETDSAGENSMKTDTTAEIEKNSNQMEESDLEKSLPDDPATNEGQDTQQPKEGSPPPPSDKKPGKNKQNRQLLPGLIEV